MMPHTHLQLRSAQYRQTHISTRFCGTIQFLWGHGIAWLAKEFNFLFFDFGVLSFSKQILRFLLSFLGMAQQARDGVNIITFCFCFLFLQNFEIVCTIWAHHVGFACWAHGQAGIPFYSPSPGETRLASCAGSICMLNGSGCVLKATQSLFICCSLVLFWVWPGNPRGARIHGVYFDSLFSIILESGCPHS